MSQLSAEGSTAVDDDGNGKRLQSSLFFVFFLVLVFLSLCYALGFVLVLPSRVGGLDHTSVCVSCLLGSREKFWLAESPISFSFLHFLPQIFPRGCLAALLLLTSMVPTHDILIHPRKAKNVVFILDGLSGGFFYLTLFSHRLLRLCPSSSHFSSPNSFASTSSRRAHFTQQQRGGG